MTVKVLLTVVVSSLLICASFKKERLLNLSSRKNASNQAAAAADTTTWKLSFLNDIYQSFVTYHSTDDPSEKIKPLGRALYDSENNLLLVDGDGNQYEPYSLAWRYLGMYLDCNGSDDDDRNSGSGDGDNDCYRAVLWAAYIDPRYRGGSIGEYKFYDFDTGTYDDATCRGRRCVKMDCHERNTHYKLLGVFKELDGMYDFAEQLFKHQGYCVWDEDEYEFMSEYRESWPSSCKKLSYYDSGNYYNYITVYWNIMPLPEGNFTYGFYDDESCTEPSSYNVTDYITSYYINNYYSSDYAQQAIEDYLYKQQMLNEYMKVWKICQPCRAYSKYYNVADEDGSDSEDGNEDENNQDEGGGSSEQWGYNCYDDAGYRNCNQCYKFETKTDMKAASILDLETASAQGTILEIKVKGKIYGKGGYGTNSGFDASTVLTFTFAVAFIILGIVVWKLKRKLLTMRRKGVHPSLSSQTSSTRSSERKGDGPPDDDDGSTSNDWVPEISLSKKVRLQSWIRENVSQDSVSSSFKEKLYNDPSFDAQSHLERSRSFQSWGRDNVSNSSDAIKLKSSTSFTTTSFDRHHSTSRNSERNKRDVEMTDIRKGDGQFKDDSQYDPPQAMDGIK